MREASVAPVAVDDLEVSPGDEPPISEIDEFVLVVHSGFPSLFVSGCCNTRKGLSGGFDLGTNEGNTVSPEV